MHIRRPREPDYIIWRQKELCLLWMIFKITGNMHNQVNGYELTSPLWLRVDFLGTSRSGYELT